MCVTVLSRRSSKLCKILRNLIACRAILVCSHCVLQSGDFEVLRAVCEKLSLESELAGMDSTIAVRISVQETLYKYDTALEKANSGMPVQASSVLGTPPALNKILSRPKRTVRAQLVIPSRSKTVKVYEAVCVQHSDIVGPCIGGLQLDTSVSLDQTKA